MIHQASSQSQLSDTKGSAYYFDENKLASNLYDSKLTPNQGVPVADLDSQAWLNNSIYAGDSSGQKLGGLYRGDLRHLKQQKSQFDNEYKQHFFESLVDQIEKRIQQVNF